MYSAGANKLIADGATPVTSVDDILDLLGIREIRSLIKDDVLLGEDEKAPWAIHSRSRYVDHGQAVLIIRGNRRQRLARW